MQGSVRIPEIPCRRLRRVRRQAHGPHRSRIGQ